MPQRIQRHVGACCPDGYPTRWTQGFCADALEEALARHGPPEIFTTDQGCQFTSQGFIGVLEAHAVQISMDGKGCYRDNIFMDRLWRHVKYECVYLKAIEDGAHLKRELRNHSLWHNQERPHQGLNDATSDEMYFPQPLTQAARRLGLLDPSLDDLSGGPEDRVHFRGHA